MTLRGPQLFVDWRHVDAGEVLWRTETGPVGQWNAAPADTFGVASGPFGVRLASQKAETVGPIIPMDRPWETNYNMYFANALVEDGIYRAWYTCIPPDHLTKPGLRWRKAAGQVVCYAESDDGFTWRKPELGRTTFDGQQTNIVFGRDLGPYGFQSGSLFKDPTAPAEERYKLIYMGEVDTDNLDELKSSYRRRFGESMHPSAFTKSETGGTAKVIAGAVSPDGIRWTPILEPLMIYPSDTLNNAGWDESLKSYVGYFRTRRHGRRCIVRAATRDFRQWSELPTVVLEAPLDWPLSDDVYTNSKTLYPGTDDVHLMFPGVFHRFEDSRDIFLAASSNGVQWQWTPGGAVVGLGPVGSWNGGDLNPGIGLVPLSGDRIALPIMGYCRPHKFPRGGEEILGQPGWAIWPKGRLSALVADNRGAFSTPKLTSAGSELSLNLKTVYAGMVKVEIRDERGTALPGYGFADADPIAGDALDRRVTWRGNSDIGALAGRPITLAFQLTSASLFAFEFVS